MGDYADDCIEQGFHQYIDEIHDLPDDDQEPETDPSIFPFNIKITRKMGKT